MIFWTIAGILGLAAVVAIVAPLTRGSRKAADRGEHELAVLKDQLAEIERDRSALRLADAEADAARLEVERRILAQVDRVAERSDRARDDVRIRRFLAAAVVIVGLPAGTLALYLVAGSPGLPDQPLAARSEERARMAEIAERRQGLVEMVEGLERRLADQPDDVDGWKLLGRTRLTLEDPEMAVLAFARAAEIGGDAEAYAELGEALVRRDRGAVTLEARNAFQAALDRAPGDPRARYYLGLADLQGGEDEAGLRTWLALEADTPADAPWRATLQARIAEAAAETGIDVAALREEMGVRRPTASGPRGPSEADVAAARDMPADDRLAMIRGMVEELEARLQEDPSDVEGWSRLGRSWGVLGDPEKSLAAYREAAERAPDRVDVLLDYARALFPPGTDDRVMPDAFIDVIAKVRALDPNNGEGLFFGGVIALHEGDTATARALWGQLITTLPADSPVRAALEQRLATLDEG